MHDALAEKIAPPDLVVYLQAKTDVLMQRIAMRDRPYERSMEHSYIEQVNQAYERFFSDQSNLRSPVLTLDTNGIDYVRDEEDLKQVENRIRQRLKMPPFQTELPLGDSND